jgi:formylglycine-generating enzyme required for sulfatase activity
MKQVTVVGLFCLLLIFVTQNGCTKKEPPSADNETTNEISSESHQPEQGKVITNSIGMKLVYIPAGSFMMGSSRSATQLAPEVV